MTNSSRELGGKVVRGLAKVGLVWSLAVLAVLFMAMSAEGQYGGRGVASDQASAAPTAVPASPAAPATNGGPRAAGVALALVFLGAGGTVLVVGAARDERALRRRYVLQSDPAAQLPMAFGLSQLG
jgi:Mn2+/Fe2+ NRAMP family transporter